MSMQDLGIEYKRIDPMLVAYMRFNLKERAEALEKFKELAQVIPEESIAGAPYLILQYFSSYSEGFEAEVGFPIKQPFEYREIKCKTTPALEVLSMMHTGQTPSMKRAASSRNCFASKRL